MVDEYRLLQNIKMLLKTVKQLAFEIAKLGSQTEQGLCLFVIFVIDIANLGISSLLEKRLPVSGPKIHQPSGKQNTKVKKVNHGSAVSNEVAKLIRSFYSKLPVYLLSEERLVDEVIGDKIFSSENERKIDFIGFDCEWVSRGSGNKGDDEAYFPVALLQISTPSECILIQICHLRSIPNKLKSLLENRHILKFGVGIEEDCKRLRMFGIQVCGTVDLRYLIQRCYHKIDIIKFPERINGLSLASLSAAIINVQMDKSYRVRCSNWEAKQLSSRQISYASNDAVVALQIFLALCVEKVRSKKAACLGECLQLVEQKPTNDQLLLISFLSGKSFMFNQTMQSAEPSSGWKNYAHCTHINSDVTKVGFSLCQGIIDLSFKNKSNLFYKKTSSDSNLTRMSDSSIPIRKTPLYHNCLLIAPDGCLLCTCDKKKAEWYVNKNLGAVIKLEPYTVQLNFDPSGRPFTDRDYYMTVKENRCVVCGKEEDYVKKMVIPRDYRRHFPSTLKDHLSHDVLLLCVSCHQTSELHDLQLKTKLAEEYSVPLNNAKTVEDKKLKRVRSAAKALASREEEIPKERQIVLKNIVREFLQEDEIDVEKLKALANIGTSKENEFYIGSHGERIVKKLAENGNLKDFVKMWREHFLDTMKPKFLPDYWSVDHNFAYFSSKEI